MTDLKPVIEACTPRSEVLSGEIRDELFAAPLSDVVAGRAHPIYQYPEQFFANTHITERVQSFLNEVLGRLSGTDSTARSLFRIDTTMGGGKTHTLIALYHLSAAKLRPQTVQRIGLDPKRVPSRPIKVVTIVGDDLNPADGVAMGAVKVYQPWGELAYHLGQEKGYSLVANSDQNGTAPDTNFLDRLIGTQPALIMIDEPANAMRRMGRNANQFPSFLKSLTEWVTRPSSRTVLVITLAWDPVKKLSEAFAKETAEIGESLETHFKETATLASREAGVVTLGQKADIAPILRQRLFSKVDPAAAAATADAYTVLLKEAEKRGAMLPARVLSASYHDELERSYPFHPSLIDVLDGKLSTMPNFQRTRGALRSLTRVVRSLYLKKGSTALLIHPFCLDLGQPEIVDEVTTRLDRPDFRSVAQYDVANPAGQAHAQIIDSERFAGHPQYAQRVATTIFLSSLPEPPSRGINLDELLEATLTPGAEPAHIQKALEHLKNEAWHLDYQGERHFFRTEPTLAKIVNDEVQQVSNFQARSEVERRIKQLWRAAGLEVEHFPSDPSAVANDRQARLVVMHWDSASFYVGAAAVPAQVLEISERSGTQRDLRLFRNALFFLVADAGERDRMIAAARRWLALEMLTKDTKKLDDYKLSKEHRERVRDWRNEADLNARIAVSRAYRHLFYRVGAVDSLYKPLAHHMLSLEDQADTKAINLTERIEKVLREDLNKVLAADDPPLTAALVKRDSFNKDETFVNLDELFSRFAQRDRLPVLLSELTLKDMVRMGVKAKTWFYYDIKANIAYSEDQDIKDIVVDTLHAVILPEAAAAKGVTLYTRPSKDKLHGEAAGPGGGASATAEKLREAYAPKRLDFEGAPGKALADLVAAAKDAKWKAVDTIQVRWTGHNKDASARLASIKILAGQLPNAELKLRVSSSAQLPDASWEMKFQGDLGRYQGLASSAESITGAADDAFADISLAIQFGNGASITGPEVTDLSDALGLASLGTVSIEATEKGGQKA